MKNVLFGWESGLAMIRIGKAVELMYASHQAESTRLKLRCSQESARIFGAASSSIMCSKKYDTLILNTVKKRQ